MLELGLKLDLDTLQSELQSQRFYRSKAKKIASCQIIDQTQCENLNLVFLENIYTDSSSEIYFLAINDAKINYDKVLDFFSEQNEIQTQKGKIYLKKLCPESLNQSLKQSPKAMDVEQSNLSLIYGQRLIAKVLPKLDKELNPESEILNILTEQDFKAVPSLKAELIYETKDFKSSLVLVQDFISNQGDLWSYLLENHGDNCYKFTGIISLLGKQTALMHKALQQAASQPLESKDLEQFYKNIEQEKNQIKNFLSHNPQLKKAIEAKAPKLENLNQISKSKVHGDYHLGQVIIDKEQNLYILDFEGEPLKSIAERKQFYPAHKDIAGMLRSLSYLTFTLKETSQFEQTLQQAFLEAYVEVLALSETDKKLIELFEFEKALYELNYELNNRPDWLEVPLAYFS